MKKAEQLEHGWSRRMLTPGEKKFKKKLTKRGTRRQAKKIDEPNPVKNNYNGWSI